MGLILFLLVFAVFWESLQVGFVGDDYYFLDSSTTWDQVQSSFHDIWLFMGIDDYAGARFYRPLQILFTYLELLGWGENPWGFHVDLILIHLGNSLLLFLLLRVLFREFKPYYPWIPWLATFGFALHPYHSETLCMINGRTDSLCALFYLASLVTYVYWRDTSSRSLRILSIFFFVCSLLSKEMAVSLPVILLIYEIARYRHNCLVSRHRLSPVTYLRATSLHWWAFLLVFGVIRTWALGGYVFGKESYVTPVASLNIYLLAACKLISVICLPFQSVIRDLSESFIAHPDLYGWSMIVVGLIVWFFAIYRGSIISSMGFSLWWISAIPVWTQLTEFQTTLSDRYLYIPSIGLFLVLGDLLLRGRRYHSMLGWVMGMALLGWTLAMIPQNRQYVKEWNTAGRTAASIVRQIERFDRERPTDEVFCFLSLPVLYQGKTILNTGFERYQNQKKIRRGEPLRALISLSQMDLIEPPEVVKTDTRFRGQDITQTVQGGYYRFPLYNSHPQIRLVTDAAIFPSHTVDFRITYAAKSLFLLAFDQGRVVPLSPPVDRWILAQGSGGEGNIEQLQSFSTSVLAQPAITDGLKQNGLIDPRRG